MKRILIIFWVVLATGCANIPLSTMLKFSSFNEQDFIALDASDIQTRVSISKPFTIKLEDTQLALDLNTDKGTRRLEFPLTLIQTTEIAAEDGFFSSVPAKTEYTFKLSEEAIANFQDVQQTLLTEPGINGGFSVSTGFNEQPDAEQTILISIALQLDKDDGFFVLVEDADVEFAPNN